MAQDRDKAANVQGDLRRRARDASGPPRFLDEMDGRNGNPASYVGQSRQFSTMAWSVAGIVAEAPRVSVDLPVVSPFAAQLPRALIENKWMDSYPGETRDPVPLLLIDDDLALGELLKEFAGPEGFAVSVAVTGEQGLMHLKEGSFALAVLDVMLPQMNGFAVLEQIRKTSNYRC